VDGNVRKPLVMGNSIGSTYSDDINLRRRRSSSGQSIATTRESFSRTSNSARDSALVDPRTMVPRRQRRRITARRNDAVLLSLSRLIVETGRRTDWVDVSESWDEKKVETLVEAMLLAPRQQGLDEPCGEYQEECPICFYFYARVNRSSCCNKPICTNCFVHIQRKIRKKCPYCNKWGLEVYLPKQSCCSDTEKQQSWTPSDKENERDSSTGANCDKREDSDVPLKRLENDSTRNGGVEQGSFSEEKEARREGDGFYEEQQDAKECSLVDISDSVVPETSSDVLLMDPTHDSKNTGKCRNEEEMSEVESSMSMWLFEQSASDCAQSLASYDYLRRRRSMNESFLDSLAIATNRSNTISPSVSFTEQYSYSEPSGGSQSFMALTGVDENCLFPIEEEDNNMFIELFRVGHSSPSDNSSGSIRDDNLIHLWNSEEEKNET